MQYHQEEGEKAAHVLFPKRVDIHHGMPAMYFTQPDWKLLVASVLYRQNEILLIEPMRAPRGSCTWIFPQEKVQFPKDRTFLEAALRGLGEELGITRRQVKCWGAESLYQFSNPIPRSRNDGRSITKHIVYFPVELRPGTCFVLNEREVHRAVWVKSFEDFVDLQELSISMLGEHRRCKCAAQLEVVLAMQRAGHILWDDIPDELLGVDDTLSEAA